MTLTQAGWLIGAILGGGAVSVAGLLLFDRQLLFDRPNRRIVGALIIVVGLCVGGLGAAIALE